MSRLRSRLIPLHPSLRASTKAKKSLLLRTCSAAETYSKVAAFLPRLGITRVARQTDLDRLGIPVWCAFTPNAKSIVIANGKGLDDDSARISAMMEAIERSIASQAACETMRASTADLRRIGQDFDRLDCLLAPGSNVLQDDEIIDWALAKDLLTGTYVWLPYEAVTMDRTILRPRYWQSSDGLASGNTQAEAILHGLLERVERDALTLWEVARAPFRYKERIDPETGGSEMVGLLRRIQQAQMQIAIFDITNDTGIPVACAMLGPQRLDGRGLRHVDITLGAGAGLSLEAAAIRAVTEAAQSRMTFIAGARDDLFPELYQRPLSDDHKCAFESRCKTTLSDSRLTDVHSPEQALDLVLSTLQTSGQKKLYAVDLTPGWLPVSVVKVVAPDLENPEGERRTRYGARALSRALQ
ncbi:YcaO-like family protein [Rhizobium rhizoryzae]|nr:YcaO-like family protein [Rhizobium rhizoryzae]